MLEQLTCRQSPHTIPILHIRPATGIHYRKNSNMMPGAIGRIAQSPAMQEWLACKYSVHRGPKLQKRPVDCLLAIKEKKRKENQSGGGLRTYRPRLLAPQLNLVLRRPKFPLWIEG